VTESNGPWEIVDSEIAYENDWIRVRHDTVRTPAGAPGIYGVIEMKPAVGVVALDGDGFTYLVGQHRYPHRAYSWEIPEGAGRDDEAVDISARRELREETGLTAERWKSLGTMHTSNCVTDETAYLFLAEGLQQGEDDQDETEQITVRRMPFAEALAMVRSGEIQDAMSIVGLLRAEELLASR
jgi:8-oxo-dGTP pyrophosphatase MutT (NUDIX family)